jgi:hypothetical protein
MRGIWQINGGKPIFPFETIVMQEVYGNPRRAHRIRKDRSMH